MLLALRFLSFLCASALLNAATTPNAAAVGSNVALAGAGGVATASSTASPGYPASAVNNNERAGARWGNGGGWADGTPGTFPDWVQIAFNGSKTIDRVVVYTLQDNYRQPVEPTDATTFATYGITAFTVERWTGTNWSTLATVSGNTLVKRTVTFAPTATERIRINVTAARGAGVYITEIEAWTPTGAGGPTPTTTTLSSSGSPAAAGASVSFTASVSGTNPTGTVGFRSDGNAIGGCTAVALTGSGNSKSAVCTTNGLAVGTHSIVASYAGDANNAASTSAALAQAITAVGVGSNVALAGAGGVATASSTASPGYPASAVNNNERAGAGWGNGGGWADGTPGTFPDSVQIAFNGSKTIDRVVVYTLQDNYTQPVEPTDATTFATYGITAFTVERWTGTNWSTLATVSGNTLVKRTVTFAPTATERIRINVTAARGAGVYITEIEAWTAGAEPGDPEVPPVVHGALAETAAAMPVGTWAEFITGDIGSVIARGGSSGSMIPFAGAMPWDAVHRQIHIVGSDHRNSDGRPAYYNRYDADSNDWSIVLRTPLGSHGYQHTAVDSEGNVYLLSTPTSAIYKWNGSDFVHFAALPVNTSQEVAMAMVHWSGPGFGAKGALIVHHGSIGALFLLALDTGAWVTMHGAIPPVGYHVTAAYSAKKNVMVYGGGNNYQGVSSKEIWRLNADRSKTRMPDAPLQVGINHGMVPVTDSKSGNFLFFGFGQLWELNPDGAGTWTRQTGTRAPPADLLDPAANGHAALVPVDCSTYGVTLWIDSIYNRTPIARVRIYKHAP